ncbi:TolC family protein [soil metagenome]
MKFLLVVVIVSLLAVPGGRAGETIDLNLQKAVRLALAKSFRIKVSEYDPKIAKAHQLSASGKFDPTLEASASYGRTDNELRSLSSSLTDPVVQPGLPPLDDLYARTTTTQYETSVSGLTPWGLSYSIGPSVTIDDNNQRDPNFTRYNSFFGLSLTQPLLKGFGTDVNLAQIRIARADRAISLWQMKQEIINVITETIFAYSELYFAIGNLDVEKRSRDLAAQLAADNVKRADIGVMTKLDVLQAQSDLATREGRVLVAERAVDDNENFLKQLVTDEISGILTTHLEIVPPTLADTPEPDRKRDFARAFDLRPDYRQALLDIQKRNINVVFTRNEALPQLDLTGSLGLNGIDTKFSSSYERLEGNGNHNFTGNIGATFSLPVPNRTAVGNLEAAKLETVRALVDLKRLEQQIYVDADNAYGQIDTTRKRVEATGVARRFAAETLKAAQVRLENGRSTTFEVLQFQRDLAQAEADELRAQADYIKAVAQYARLIGATLERNRIIVE